MLNYKYKINPAGIILIITIILCIIGYNYFKKSKIVSSNKLKLEEFSLRHISKIAEEHMNQFEKNLIKVESFSSLDVESDGDYNNEVIVFIEFVPTIQDELNLNKYFAILLLDIDQPEVIVLDQLINFEAGWNSISSILVPHTTDLNNDNKSEIHILTSITGTAASNNTVSVFDLANSKFNLIWNRDNVEYVNYNPSLSSYYVYTYDWQFPEGRVDEHRVFIEQINTSNFEFNIKKKLHTDNKFRINYLNYEEILANGRQVLLK